MVELLLVVVLLAVVAVIVGTVATGTWSRTWVASGRELSGRRYPGGPSHL